jgi:hypothetical protein
VADGISAEFFTSVLDSNREQVQAAVRDAMLDGIKRQFQWELPEAVKKEVTAFMVEEVIPQIRAELTANKDEFVTAATTLARAAPAELAKAMQEHVAKQLTNSWTLRKVTEALFS